MKTIRTAAVLAATVAFGLSVAHAGEEHDVTAGQKLVKSNACFTCHAVSAPKIGPAFAAVAAKYKGNADAQKILMDIIANGVKGTPMPANAQLSDAERDQIVDWILSLKK
jgi:cytochrome c